MIVKGTIQLGSFREGINLYVPQKRSIRTPAQIPNLGLWLDASDSSTLFQNSDGTGTVTNGSVVGYWGDKSGNSRNVTKTGDVRPTFQTSIKNGLSIVRFDGDNDVLSGTGFMYNSLAGVTIFTVVKGNPIAGRELIAERMVNPSVPGSYGPIQAKVFGGSIPSPILNSFISLGSSNNILLRTTASVNRDYGTAFDNTWRLVGCIDDAPNKNYKAFIDGVQTGNQAYDNDSLDPDRASPFNNLNIGAGTSGGSLAFQCDLAEVIVYTRALNTNERQAVEAYLRNKWAI